MDHNPVSETYLTPAQRRILFLTLLTVLSLYLVINRLMSWQGDGTTVEIWLDRYVPFWPIWSVPYVLSILWWGVAALWAYLKMEDSLYVAFITGWISACLIGYAIFIFYPNYMVRPQVTGTGWAEGLIRFIYTNDRTYNAFPSQHLWDTVIITLIWSRWKPKWRWLLWGLTLIVAMSTLFTGQHWIMDVIGGTLLAMVGYFIGLMVAARLTSIPQRWPDQAGR
ncbi:MAG: phosphatase PAP2 family protein [Anaerolineae bacterium]|jgi:membrane-associated phospholipid phosphatase